MNFAPCIGIEHPTTGSAFAGKNYVKDGLVFDGGPLSGASVPDLSPEGNDATLHTGRFVSTDGISDKGLNADISSIPRVVTAKAWVRSPVSAVLGMGIQIGFADSSNHSIFLNNTYVHAGVWEEISFTRTDIGAGAQGAVILGFWEYTTGYEEADWSDVRFYDADDNIVAHWPLSESTPSDLDGHPAFDVSGNDNHGTHVGCSGGAGETTITQSAAQNWNRYSAFNGVDNYIQTTEGFQTVGKLQVSFVFTNTEGVVAYASTVGSKGLSVTCARTTGNVHVTFENGASVFEHVSKSGFVEGESVTVDIEWDMITGSTVYNVTFNGAGSDGSLAGRHSSTDSINWRLGANGNATQPFFGLLYNAKVYDTDLSSLIAQWNGYGENPWVDTVGTEDGTESGTFSKMLVSESAAVGTDLLNNPIDVGSLRLLTRDINLFGEEERVLIPDDDSLDLTTQATWELWGNFYHTDSQQYFSKYSTTPAGRSWAIGKNSGTEAVDEIRLIISSDGSTAGIVNWGGIPDAFGHLVVTYNTGTVTAYWNGVSLGAPSTVSGSIPSSIYVSVSDILIGAIKLANADQFYSGILGSPKIYNRTLTAVEVLKNYNAQKNKY